jgi:hypothetical protein
MIMIDFASEHTRCGGSTDAAGFTSRYGPLSCTPPRLGRSTLGFDPARFQTKPPACYRATWQLPGPDSHRQATTSLRNERSTTHMINQSSLLDAPVTDDLHWEPVPLIQRRRGIHETQSDPPTPGNRTPPARQPDSATQLAPSVAHDMPVQTRWATAPPNPTAASRNPKRGVREMSAAADPGGGAALDGGHRWRHRLSSRRPLLQIPASTTSDQSMPVNAPGSAR